MRNVLVRGTTDRGTEFRHSTRNKELLLEVFYKDKNKTIRKVSLAFVPAIDTENLLVVVDSGKERYINGKLNVLGAVTSPLNYAR